VKIHPLFVVDTCLYLATIWFFAGLFLSSAKAFVLALVVAGIATGVALSPVGEMAALHSLRARPATRREQDQLFGAVDLLPDLAAVLRDLRARIWIVDSALVNGCAVGRQSIVLTTGALRDPSACAAVLAHEAAHLRQGHGVQSAALFLLSLPIILVHSLAASYCAGLRSVMSPAAARANPMAALLYVPFLLAAWMVASMAALAHRLTLAVACAASRAHELAADAQAARWGAGEHLVRLLESMPPAPTAMGPGWGWVWATHPAPAVRIDAIEREIEREMERPEPA
jgi:Zn-dependent protease with chaperone function